MEAINPRCEAVLTKLREKGVPLVCYSIWSKTEVLNLGGNFFTHLVTNEGRWLWDNDRAHMLTEFDATDFVDPIHNFVDSYERVGLRIDPQHPRIATFDLNGSSLTADQEKAYEELARLMMNLVEESDEFAVEAYDTELAILRTTILAFKAANSRLGWEHKIHLTITDEHGCQSLHDGGQIRLCVKEGSRLKDADELADVLEWILSCFQ